MHRFVMKSALSLASILTIALVGCSAQNPDDLPDLLPDAGEQVENPDKPTLTIEGQAVVTPWPSVPVQGRGPKNGTLVVDLPGGGQDTLSLGAAGDFCLDIELAEGSNTIRFEAISSSGVYSDPEVISVRREGDPPEPPEPIDDIVLADRTPGAFYLDSLDTGCCNHGADIYEEVGTFDQLIDGNMNEYMKMKGNGYYAGEFVAFTLKERMAVHGFEITVPDQDGDTCAPEGFEMWVSDKTTPEVTDDGVNFVKVASLESSEASATATTYELASTVRGIHAQHMALRITDATCGGLFSSVSGVAEIRVIAEKDGLSEPTYDGMPSCASGGF